MCHLASRKVLSNAVVTARVTRMSTRESGQLVTSISPEVVTSEQDKIIDIVL